MFSVTRPPGGVVTSPYGVDSPAPATGSAQSSLLYVLGDLVHPSSAPYPTSAFLAALCDVGHEEHAARQALARASKAGWISSSRHGREAWWSLTERGRSLIADGQQRISDLGRDEDDWDGRWVIVVVSIPHARRAIRSRVYRYLTWSGFGAPMPGIWVSPHLRNQHGARFAISNFGLAETSLSFVGTTGDLGLSADQMVSRAWDLDDLDAHYTALLERHRDRRPGSGAASLRAVIDIDADLQQLPMQDPQLPSRLAPGRVSRSAARQLLTWRSERVPAARDHWHGLARRA